MLSTTLTLLVCVALLYAARNRLRAARDATDAAADAAASSPLSVGANASDGNVTTFGGDNDGDGVGRRREAIFDEAARARVGALLSTTRSKSLSCISCFKMHLLIESNIFASSGGESACQVSYLLAFFGAKAGLGGPALHKEAADVCTDAELASRYTSSIEELCTVLDYCSLNEIELLRLEGALSTLEAEVESYRLLLIKTDQNDGIDENKRSATKRGIYDEESDGEAGGKSDASDFVTSLHRRAAEIERIRAEEAAMERDRELLMKQERLEEQRRREMEEAAAAAAAAAATAAAATSSTTNSKSNRFSKQSPLPLPPPISFAWKNESFCPSYASPPLFLVALAYCLLFLFDTFLVESIINACIANDLLKLASLVFNLTINVKLALSILLAFGPWFLPSVVFARCYCNVLLVELFVLDLLDTVYNLAVVSKMKNLFQFTGFDHFLEQFRRNVNPVFALLLALVLVPTSSPVAHRHSLLLKFFVEILYFNIFSEAARRLFSLAASFVGVALSELLLDVVQQTLVCLFIVLHLCYNFFLLYSVQANAIVIVYVVFTCMRLKLLSYKIDQYWKHRKQQ